ncbi:MAG: response regulator [Candidatus Bathyarchaeia archaeon]|jgi:DNA-binding response OmpR family regulator
MTKKRFLCQVKPGSEHGLFLAKFFTKQKPGKSDEEGMLEVAVSKKTILVVDDDKSILRTFTRILQKSGYEIDTAETGKEAIEKTENRHYDLALVDIRLPDMDGTDLLAKLKKQLQQTVKIMITGFPSLETGVKALDEGADAYLVKPVKPQELLVLLEEKLKNREESAEVSH